MGEVLMTDFYWSKFVHNAIIPLIKKGRRDVNI